MRFFEVVLYYLGAKTGNCPRSNFKYDFSIKARAKANLGGEALPNIVIWCAIGRDNTTCREERDMSISGLHHVAYRCRNARETTDFYARYLDLNLTIAVAENKVPSTGEWSPHIHIFLKMDDGSFLAFFELPESPEMQMDQNTPDWVQHLALKVADMDTLNDYKKRLTDDGINVVGPTDHRICQSIYFFDPNGHRMELTVDTTTPDMAAELGRRAVPLLAEWDKTKRAPDVDAFMHGGGDS